MNLLSLENITKAYTERVLLDGASFFSSGGREGRHHRDQRNRQVHAAETCGWPGRAGYRKIVQKQIML